MEYTIQSNVLVELDMPPPGPATRKALAQAISRRPLLRLLGVQESKQLYEKLATTSPDYTSVVKLLTGF